MGLEELCRVLLGSSPPCSSHEPPIACFQDNADSVSSQGGICFLCIVYTYFRVPEPSGRSFAELDLLFQKGVSARKFAETQVNVFEEDIDGDVMANYHKHSKVTGVEYE